MIKFDITLFVQIGEALLMTFILYYILVRPIMSYIKEREAHFQTLEKETQDLIASAEEAIKRYQEELNKARAEGVQKRELMKEEARKIEKDILSKVMKEMEEYKTKWAEQFSKQLEDVRKELMDNVEYFASLMVERLLGRKV